MSAAGKIAFRCAHCERRLKVPVALAGRKGPCPSCKQTTRVPRFGVSKSASPPEPVGLGRCFKTISLGLLAGKVLLQERGLFLTKREQEIYYRDMVDLAIRQRKRKYLPAVYGLEIHLLDGERVYFELPSRAMATWIEEQSLPHMYRNRAMREQQLRTEGLDLGPVRLGPDAIEVGDRAIPYESISGLHCNGMNMVVWQRGQFLPAAVIPQGRIKTGRGEFLDLVEGQSQASFGPVLSLLRECALRIPIYWALTSNFFCAFNTSQRGFLAMAERILDKPELLLGTLAGALVVAPLAEGLRYLLPPACWVLFATPAPSPSSPPRPARVPARASGVGLV